VIIAAAKNTVARISSIILWPLNILAKRKARANRKIIRWAIRKRSRTVYLAAVLWFPILTVAGIVWALMSIHEKPSDTWPTLAAVSLFAIAAKKVLSIFYYLIVVEGDKLLKAFRLYRRRFR
jgi:hypothetical protein